MSPHSFLMVHRIVLSLSLMHASDPGMSSNCFPLRKATHQVSSSLPRPCNVTEGKAPTQIKIAKASSVLGRVEREQNSIGCSAVPFSISDSFPAIPGSLCIWDLQKCNNLQSRVYVKQETDT